MILLIYWAQKQEKETNKSLVPTVRCTGSELEWALSPVPCHLARASPASGAQAALHVRRSIGHPVPAAAVPCYMGHLPRHQPPGQGHSQVLLLQPTGTPRNLSTKGSDCFIPGKGGGG